MSKARALEPIVTKYHVSGLRNGKGFSLSELKSSEICVHEAKMHNIPVDDKRKSAHPNNIEALKNLKSKNFKL